MKSEYKTTCGSARTIPNMAQFSLGSTPDDPIQPEGNGWELIGMAATEKFLYWTWRRLIMEKV